MVADRVDASFAYSEYMPSKPAIACMDPVVFGREQEIERLNQELQAESVDDFDELWNIEPANAAVENDMGGKNIDFESLRDYASDCEPGHTYLQDFYIDTRRKWHKRLTSRSRHRLDCRWPLPVGTKSIKSEDEDDPLPPLYDMELVGGAMDDRECEFASLGCLCCLDNRQLVIVSGPGAWELVFNVLVLFFVVIALSL